MIAGIDLGTSSVKILCIDQGHTVGRAQAVYDSSMNRPVTEQWAESICRAFGQLKNKDKITAIGLSSQVGTYIVNGKEVLSWQEPVGKAELKEIRDSFSKETFVQEISMNHPDILSYPMPRILWLQKKYAGREHIDSVRQPKEWMLRFLTKEDCSDPYSWRGLASQTEGQYSKKMLEYLRLTEEALPPLTDPCKKTGKVSKEAAYLTGIKEGIPVYNGCNDYYASLLGMGITQPGQMYDVTGTSEHVGVITEHLQVDTRMISSPYFQGNVLYGVTASSGASLAHGINMYDLKKLNPDDYHRILNSIETGKKPPVFLPYVNGERAPIFDEQAKGVFFGISSETTREEMAYAVLEGVAFSTLDIFRHLDLTFLPENVIVSGGAAGNQVLNQMKADLFGIPAVVAAEPDTSAYGACILAALGEGLYKDKESAVRAMCHYGIPVLPRKVPALEKRFQSYREIYQRLKPVFRKF